MTSTPACALCSATGSLTAVVVAGASKWVCAHHQQALAGRIPTDMAELRAWMASTEEHERNRRAGPDRRVAQRRQFPPRPEGRRHNDGRRRDDVG